MKNSTSESMDNLTVRSSEEVSQKETLTETMPMMSEQRFQNQGDFDTPGNARNIKKHSYNDIEK